MSDIDYEEIIPELFEIITDFKNIQNDQKKRGLNDANTFTMLFRVHDEVRLHSRFIKFLLDPNANHYQDDLFLKPFLETIGLSNFIDTTKCRVVSEYKSIDIYITDGTNHIILENKIWAGDRDGQIARYITTIEDENNDEQLKPSNLQIIYLSPYFDRHPSDNSLHDTGENGKKLEWDDEEKPEYLIWKTDNQEHQYPYLKISYESHILDWLKKSYEQIENITNLSFMIAQYKEVIEELLGIKKEKVMRLEDYLKEKTNKSEIIDNMEEITKAYKECKSRILPTFWNGVIDDIQNSVGKDWQIKRNAEKSSAPDKRTVIMWLGYKNDSSLPRFEIVYEWDCKKLYYGIYTPSNSSDNLIARRSGDSSASSWYAYKYYGDKEQNAINMIMQEKSIENFVDEFMTMFDYYKKSIEEKLNTDK